MKLKKKKKRMIDRGMINIFLKDEKEVKIKRKNQKKEVFRGN
jgi:hypothetical protein